MSTQKYNTKQRQDSGRKYILPYEGYTAPEGIPKFDDPEFLGERALDWAIFITDARWDERNRRFRANNKISTHQIRRYYSEFKSIERSISDALTEDIWNTNFQRMKILIAKATYDSNRSMNRLPSKFKIFITKCVKVIPSNISEGFPAFKKICLLFEAVLGYSSEYTRE